MHSAALPAPAFGCAAGTLVHIFRSDRISSVYIVGCWLLVVGRHTFSKFVHFECCSVVMMECKSVRVLEC